MKRIVFMLTMLLSMLCMSVQALAFDGSSGGVGAGGIIVGVIIGILIAVFVMLGHKSKLKSVRMQSAAANYIKQGSFRLTTSREIYLYKRVERREKPKNNN